MIFSLPLSSLCHVFFATWCHLTREMASHFPAEDLGAFQVLGELRAVTAPASSAGAPGTLEPCLCLTAEPSPPVLEPASQWRPATLSGSRCEGGPVWTPLWCPARVPGAREGDGKGCPCLLRGRTLAGRPLTLDVPPFPVCSLGSG